jgi:4-amino-4-deoxy-L-arabinose transferase-like glycosyltransferase
MVGNKDQETEEQRAKGAEKQKNSDTVTPRPAGWRPTPPTAYHLFATVVVVVSIAWRVSNLDAFSLSNDEGAYLMWAWLVHSGHPLYSETVSVSAPFLVVALDWAYDLAGVSLITGRALVLGFWGLALFSLIWSGRLLHHWLSGLMAGIAFSFSPLAFVLSRMAIGEIPSLALATLSLVWALLYWRDGKRVWLALSGLVLSLSLLTKTMNPLLVLPILWLIVAHHHRNRATWS